jgi:carbon monoxide dehydrogenase subunit G
MPRATFTHQATAASPIADVWECLQQAETWENIGPVEEVHDAQNNGDGQLESFLWSTTVAAKHYPGSAQVTVIEPGRRMVLELDAREVAGSLETHLEPDGEQATIVTVTLEVVSRGMLSTLFFPVVSESVAKGLPDQVDSFAKSLN